jgi:hypothetical protein
MAAVNPPINPLRSSRMNLIQFRHAQLIISTTILVHFPIGHIGKIRWMMSIGGGREMAETIKR